MKIANAFSLNMVELPANISARKISVEQFQDTVECVETHKAGEPIGDLPEHCQDTNGWCEKCKFYAPRLESVIGHADTAAIVSGILGVDLPANRVTVKLQRGEKMIVAQYIGPRLPEGATTLPDGAKIEFILVEVN